MERVMLAGRAVFREKRRAIRAGDDTLNTTPISQPSHAPPGRRDAADNQIGNMMRKKILRSSAILASSIASLVSHGHVKAEVGGKYSKKLRESVLSQPDLKPTAESANTDPPRRQMDRYPWKKGIVTTTFWVGERPTKNNPVPNHMSSWDMDWAKNYGGTDTPDAAQRVNFIPAKFTPKQNPFYVALPYNDLTRNGYKPEASKVIPWFKEGPQEGSKKSVCKGRWIAVKFKDRVVYAQWEDAGPFRTDHHEYVFGNERPKPNLNKGAGLDVSPAVRDYLGMNDTDVTDWKFVDFDEVPNGPWTLHGENNTFVLNKRAADSRIAKAAVGSEVLGPKM
jgi:hypothetical protein